MQREAYEMTKLSLYQLHNEMKTMLTGESTALS